MGNVDKPIIFYWQWEFQTPLATTTSLELLIKQERRVQVGTRALKCLSQKPMFMSTDLTG